MTETLQTYSLFATYSAMAIYTLAFIAFTLDLAGRSSPAPVALGAVANSVQVASARGGRTTALLERLATDAPAPPKTTGRAPASTALKVAMALTTLGWVVHVAADIMRGIAAHRVPWANMFEFSLTATAIVIGVFLISQFWQDLRFLGVFVTGFVVILLGLATVNYYVPVAPTAVPLQSYWLVIHVFVASLGTGFFAIGAGLSIVQLFQNHREVSGRGPGFLRTLPEARKLENLAYRIVLIGFVFWTFTLIAGAIWAEHAWGRYWGWDTKEVWTFIIWVIFAGYIHARATRGWRGSRSAWLAIVGFAAVLFNFTIVNIFFHGLHSYSGLPGAGT